MPARAPGGLERSIRFLGPLGPVVYFSNNWISRIGLVLATTGLVAWLFTLPFHFGEDGHPYLGLLSAFALPLLFFLGLALILAGVLKRRRKFKRHGLYPDHFPAVNWASPQFRALVWFIGWATLGNLVLGWQLTYKAVAHMETNAFCGDTCHVMSPEFTAYEYAPHAQLRCVDCHIGEGFDSFIEAKANGAKQLVETVLDTFPRPIPTPVKNLAQGRLNCVKCHSDQDHGFKRRQWITFAPDESNSPSQTELLLNIGGGTNPTGAHGAHRSGGVKVEYRSDPKRQKVVWVRYTTAGGSVREYARPKAELDREVGDYEYRQMDCVDCHNRAAHSFEAPHRALDALMASGRVKAELPRVRQQSLALLRAGYTSREEAARVIPEALRGFYQSQYPESAGTRRGDIDATARELVALYSRNVFPDFGVDWETHPNLIGHENKSGCFRCHNDDLINTSDGESVIGSTCDSCHEMRAVDQPISAPSVPLLTDRSTVRDVIPSEVSYETAAGWVAFSHGEHVRQADGDCALCHNRLFPMVKTPIDYGADLHRLAEANQTSCAGCHVKGGTAFASQGSCSRCHQNLSVPKRPAASPPKPKPLPGRLSYDTSLGEAWFDHAQHVDLEKGDCSGCHNELFQMSSAPLDYGANLHRAAEAERSSCAGCHAAEGKAFASAGNCAKCHVGLGEPKPPPAPRTTKLPGADEFNTRLGRALFGHQRHVDLTQGDCAVCHTKVFPLAKGLLNYGDDLHRTAEEAKTSCAACHVERGEAFASRDNCLRCHVDLSATSSGSVMGLPEILRFAARLGDVEFDHDAHLAEAAGDCAQCHNEVFPMTDAPLDYKANYHRDAEAERSSCASCHHPEGRVFGALGNCDRCHQGLKKPTAGVRFQPPLPLGFLLFFAAPAADGDDEDGSVGAAKCAVCHEQQSSSFAGTEHRSLTTDDSCESCHGPGLEHVLQLDPEELTDFRSAQSSIVDRACLDCHDVERSLAGRFFDRHSSADVSCTGCHSVHDKAGHASAADGCSECHSDVRAAFNRPFGHKIGSGGMDCVDCHAPHSLSATNFPASGFAAESRCLDCHGDKRGPFPFEHAPVRTEPCSTCHEPHGSVNPRMLTRQTVNRLCMECHSMTDGSLGGSPTAFHDLRSPRFRSCSTCHTKIHGSYVSRGLLR